MVYMDSANVSKALGRAFQGALFGFILVILSTLSFRYGRFEVSLAFVPLIAIFLWPHGSSAILSSIVVFALGLLLDLLLGGPKGLWAFIFLICYGILRPESRRVNVPFRELWARFLGWECLVFVIILCVGWIFIEGRTTVSNLVLQIVAAFLVFPLLYSIRQALRQLVLDPDDPDYFR